MLVKSDDFKRNSLCEEKHGACEEGTETSNVMFEGHFKDGENL